jgi:hypothetical protein
MRTDGNSKIKMSLFDFHFLTNDEICESSEPKKLLIMKIINYVRFSENPN